MDIDWNPVIQGLATAIPIIVVTLGLLYKFKNELCTQISDLKVTLQTHVGISENDRKELGELKDQLSNLIWKNALKT